MQVTEIWISGECHEKVKTHTSAIKHTCVYVFFINAYIMRYLLTLAILLAYIGANAQEILGTVTDKKKEPITNASVSVKQGGILKGGTLTDIDGKYSIKPLDPGYYDVTVSYLGYQTTTITRVVVTANEKTGLNFTLDQDSDDGSKSLKCVVIKSYKKPLVDRYKTNTILTAEEIKTKPTTQTVDLVALTPGIYQSQRGGPVNSDGGRATANLYVIDGVQVQGATGIDMAQGATQQLYSSGIPANYSDATSAAKPVYLNPSDESYKKVQHNDFMTVKSTPMSTMSVDVDRASYTNIRRFLNDNQKPPADAVRVEEMVNYFDYEYAQPKGDDPVAFTTQLTECPWNKQHKLLHIGLQAKTINSASLPASNLVFLIDVSGSMMEADKLPLVQQGLNMLVDQLRGQDRISLVVYAGNAGLVLPATAGNKKADIKNAINALVAGGSTAGGAGIQLAYKIAANNFIKGGNNRVILCTDGDFNVGVSSNNELEALITKKRETGIFLTCLGFGIGNYKDDRMEMLADKGNGNYNYIDNLQEANKTLVHEFGGTIFTVAKDVKCQIEFNPSLVEGYKLIGYENRLLNTEDFKDDKKDAGDMGSGHTVTIMYEIIPNIGENCDVRPVNELKYQAATPAAPLYSSELATIKLRYKKPDDSVSKEMSHIINNSMVAFADASDNARYAASVAMFGLILRADNSKGTAAYDEVLKIAAGCNEKDEYRREFAALVKAAARIDGQLTAK